LAAPTTAAEPARTARQRARRTTRGRAAVAPSAVGDYAALGALVLDRAREEFVRVLGALAPDATPQDLPVVARVAVSGSARLQARVRREVVALLRRLAALGDEAGAVHETRRWSVTIALMPSPEGASPAAGAVPGGALARTRKRSRTRARGAAKVRAS
jgi:hypothetical protein